MATKKGTRKVCSRGHVFYKSSDRPVCPLCWPGYYKKSVGGARSMPAPRKALKPKKRSPKS